MRPSFPSRSSRIFPFVRVMLLVGTGLLLPPASAQPRQLEGPEFTARIVDAPLDFFHNPAEPVTTRLLLQQTRQDGAPAQLRLRLERPGLPPLLHSQGMEGERLELHLAPWIEQTQGHGKLFFSVVRGGNSSPEALYTFARFIPAGPAIPRSGTLRFGIAYGYRGGAEQEARAMARVGANIVRLNPHWEKIQPTADANVWDWFDRQQKAHRDQGIGLQVILHGMTRWGRRPSETGGGPIPDAEAWREWVRLAATRLRGTAEVYEIWNEPDIGFWKGSVKEYQELFRTAADLVREIDPEARITTGFASIEHGSHKPGILEAAVAEFPARLDLFGYHRHGPFDHFYREMENRILPLLRQDDRKIPLYFTETGMDTRFGEAHQAATLIKKMAYAWSIGAEAYNWYNFFDKSGGDQATRSGSTYGLFTRDERPKQSYVAYNTFVAHLKEARFLRRWELPDMQFALEFALPDESRVVVAWNEREDRASCLPLISAESKVTETDVQGRETVWMPVAGRLLLPLGPEPRLFHLPAGSRLIGPLIPQPHPPGLGGGVVDATLHFTNPDDRPLALEVTLTDPDTRLVLEGDARIHLSLEAGGSADANWRVGLRDAKDPMPYGELINGRLTARLKDQTREISIPLPFRYDTLILGPPPGVTRISLDTETFVLNRFEDDPHSLDRLWQGPEDLSARIFLRWENGLGIEGVVVDDLREAGDALTVTLLHNGQPVWKRTLALADAEVRPEEIRYRMLIPENEVDGLGGMLRKGQVRLDVVLQDHDRGKEETLLRSSGSGGDLPSPRLKLEDTVRP